MLCSSVFILNKFWKRRGWKELHRLDNVWIVYYYYSLLLTYLLHKIPRIFRTQNWIKL